MGQNDLIHILASSVLIVALTALALLLMRFVRRRLVTWIQSLDTTTEDRRQQMTTLIQLALWTLTVVLIVSALFMLLGTFGIDVTPLLASAGVVGLALSLGAQTLIKDFIGGLLIIMENQYAVGDTITVGTVRGQVEHQTRDGSRAVLDIGVAYEEDLDRALAVLTAAAGAFAQDAECKADLLEPPQVMGPVALGDSAVMLRVMAKTKPGKQWAVGRALSKFVLAACEREGVELPYPRQEVWLRTAEP
jgi:small-conductance mechanosensitive channel